MQGYAFGVQPMPKNPIELLPRARNGTPAPPLTVGTCLSKPGNGISEPKKEVVWGISDQVHQNARRMLKQTRR